MGLPTAPQCTPLILDQQRIPELGKQFRRLEKEKEIEKMAIADLRGNVTEMYRLSLVAASSRPFASILATQAIAIR